MADPIIGKISVGDGATFIPDVDNDGVISWTNNKNLANPASVDIPQAVMDRYQVAPVASPAFTGTPTAPTPTAGDDSTKIATTEYVQAELADYLELTGGSITGDVDITGDLSVSGTISGDLTGNVTGDVTGNVTGNVTGDLTGTALFTGDTGTTGADGRKFFLIHDNATSYPNYENIDLGWSFNDNDGACIALRSASNASFSGEFAINAKNGSNSATLTGKPNGELNWIGRSIPQRAYGVTLTSNSTLTVSTKQNSTIIFAKRGNYCGVYMATYWDASITTIFSTGTNPLTITTSGNSDSLSIKNNGGLGAVAIKIINADEL